MNGLGGMIAKLTNAKHNALVIFDSPEVESSGGDTEGQDGQRPKYAARRKVTTERISPFSKNRGIWPKEMCDKCLRRRH